MQKLAWMNDLRVGHEVAYWLSSPHADRPIPVKITRVGKKSVFIGNKRFSKWNGFEVNSEGRPVNAMYHAKPLHITPITVDMAQKFILERAEYTNGILNADYSKVPLDKLRWLHGQVGRLTQQWFS